MKSGYMSTNDIMESCGLKDRKYFRESYIVPGLIGHAIERKYPNEPNHPRQMYRLTKQALEWKNLMRIKANTPKGGYWPPLDA